MHFLENPQNKQEVNHIDCDKTNNCLENLEWVTPYENMVHASVNGLLGNNGVKHVLQFDLNNNYIQEFNTQAEAARAVGGDRCNIGRCCRGFYKYYKGYIWKFKK